MEQCDSVNGCAYRGRGAWRDGRVGHAKPRCTRTHHHRSGDHAALRRDATAEAGESMGQSIKGFKDGLDDGSEDDKIVDVKPNAAAETKDDAKAS